MKILHAIYSFNIGGSETMLVDIINQQCKTEAISLLIVNNKFDKNLLETIDKRVNVLLIDRKEGDKIKLLTAFWKINAIVHKICPDVIHCHDNKLFPFFFLQRKKTYLTVHATFLSDLFLKYYHKVFAISMAVQQQIKQRTGINAELIYNGIETTQYRTKTHYNFNPQTDELKIIQITRLCSKIKGQDIAIQAIARLKEIQPDKQFRLTFVGDGESLEELKDLVVENKVEDNVVFLGQKSRSWIKENLYKFDLLIQPSLYEGFGLTIIEGFACGLSVIVSDLDGPKEIIETLHSGLLVKPNNPVDLADKIYQVYQAYISNSLKNSNYILKDKNQLKIFDIQTTAKAYMDNYDIGLTYYKLN